MNTINRIPRMKGLTSFPKDQKPKLLNYIISNYLKNGFNYCNQYLSVSDLASVLRQSDQGITAQVVESSGAFSTLLKPDSQYAANQSLMFLYDRLLTWAFEDRFRMDKLYGQASEQLLYPNGTLKTPIASLLVRISEQSSKASGTLVNALNSLRSSPSQGVTPMAPQASVSGQGTSKPLSQAEALEMLSDMAQKALLGAQDGAQEGTSIGTDSASIGYDLQDKLYREEGIEGTPEVRAMGAETEGTKRLKASNQELINEEIILNLDLEDVP